MNKVGASPVHSDKPSKSDQSQRDDTQEEIFKRKDSNTLAPNDNNYQANGFDEFGGINDFLAEHLSNDITQNLTGIQQEVELGIARSKIAGGSKSSARLPPSKKRATKAYQTKKFVDIEQMLSDDDSDKDSFMPQKMMSKFQEEEKDVVMPLPSKRKIEKAIPKKASNIKMKRLTKRTTFHTQETFQSSVNQNSKDDEFSRMDSNFQNIGSSMQGPQQFQNASFIRKSKFGRFRGNQENDNPFARTYKERVHSADPVIKNQTEPEVAQKNVFENVKYGSSITLNIMDESTSTGPTQRKLNSKLRISDKINSTKMGEDEYNIN